MDLLEGLSFGLEIATRPENILAALVGALIGTLVGVLPGLGPTAGAAILLPLTFTLDPVAGLIMIAAIYYGVQYGGSTTAILLNIAGEANSVPVMRDGYQMTKQGRAGPALTIVTVGSFLAGTISVVLVAAFGTSVARLAFEFGPAEFFVIIVMAAVLLTTVMGGSLASGLVPLSIGVLVGTVGLDPVTASNRFTLGTVTLTQGISIVALSVGVFGLVELMHLVGDPNRAPRAQRVRLKQLRPSRSDLRRSWFPWGRGTAVGFIAGLIPGPAPAVATFAAYRLESMVSKNRRELGTGAVEGVAAPEAANNAAATSGMVPLLALGLPFTPALALLLAAMVVQGITPGPLLVSQNPDVFWGIIASMYIGNIALVVLNLPMVGVWVSLLRLPRHVLVTSITLFALAGAYTLNGSELDLWVVIGAGVIGYVLERTGFQLAPMALGLILGPYAEKYLRESLSISDGEVTSLFDSAVSRTLWGVLILGMVLSAVFKLVRARRRPVADEPEPGVLALSPEVVEERLDSHNDLPRRPEEAQTSGAASTSGPTTRRPSGAPSNSAEEP